MIQTPRTLDQTRTERIPLYPEAKWLATAEHEPPKPNPKPRVSIYAVDQTARTLAMLALAIAVTGVLGAGTTITLFVIFGNLGG